MGHRGLQFRMLIAGGMLFVFYLLLALFLLANGFPLVLVLLGTVLFAGVQYKFGKWAALRSVGADDLPEDRSQQIHWAVENLCQDMGIEKPRLMVADMGVPNAFAVGRKGAGVVVLSTELISRYREYVADADAATAIGSGEPLARALEKIDRGHATDGSTGGRGRSGGRGRGQSAFDAEDQVGALCIFNEKRSLLQRAFATHPPTEKRIERLRSGY